MNRKEVHRVLYGDEQDVDTIIPDQGFLGVLRSNLISAREDMAIVLSDTTTNEEETVDKYFYSCVLPYFFINQLYLYFSFSSENPIDLAGQRVEEAFEDTVIIPSNDYSTFYIGTFYEWLVKVAEFSELYINNNSDGTWARVLTQPRIDNESCGYWNGNLFFDSRDAWEHTTFEYCMAVFAPIVENKFDNKPPGERDDPCFYLEMYFPAYDNPNGFCDGLNQGVEAYGVETNMPEDVLGPLAAISFYELTDTE